MGRRGLVGLFVCTRCQGSRDRIPVFLLLFSRKKNHKTTKVSRQEEKRGAAQERREEEEEPAGVSGMDTRSGSVRLEND